MFITILTQYGHAYDVDDPHAAVLPTWLCLSSSDIFGCGSGLLLYTSLASSSSTTTLALS